MRVLVTGGAGYIGSHACLALLERGHEVLSLDVMLPGRASHEAIETLRQLGGAGFEAHEGDINDSAALDRVLAGRGVDAVMHFAGVAYIGESVRDPLLYHRTNTAGTISVLEACARHRVKRFVFSSSCVTYGEPGAALLPVTEDCPQVPTNPYGWSKLAAERVLRDTHASGRGRGAGGSGFACAALRYFNVAGCDRRGRVGHRHNPETRVIPLVIRAAIGIDPGFTVFGADYATEDGTCIRDYIHVDDLVRAHIIALEALRDDEHRTYNLGTGAGVSVRQIIESVERVTGRRVPVTTGPRREGDPAALFCSPEKAWRELGWRAEVTDLDEIVRSAWTWLERTLR
ncbi:MAG: UDP-glucose 4-epimerase GalE [Phycisphaerales bacterium]